MENDGFRYINYATLFNLSLREKNKSCVLIISSQSRYNLSIYLQSSKLLFSRNFIIHNDCLLYFIVQLLLCTCCSLQITAFRLEILVISIKKEMYTKFCTARKKRFIFPQNDYWNLFRPSLYNVQVNVQCWF